MKKLALALAATAAFAGQAIAADMPARMPMKAAPVAVPVANWTGCYLAGGIGYSLWQQENTDYDYTGANRVRLNDGWDAGGRGWTGRGQVGCDYQLGMGSWNVVIGAFGDYDWASVSGRAIDPFWNAGGSEKQSSSWAVGGRIGWLATPQLLTYFSGGYTEAQFDSVNTYFSGLPLVNTGFYVPGHTYKGWFLGSGLEYALGWAPGLYLKTEYRFSQYDVGTNQILAVANNAPLGGGFGFQVDSKKYIQNITTSLVYKFNWGGPVVAKY